MTETHTVSSHLFPLVCVIPRRRTELFPLLKLITPNETEAEILTEIKVTDDEMVMCACRKLCSLGVKTGSLPIHCVGILGGLIRGTGNVLSLIAANKAGTAISYGLGQGATLIAALWGILIWREFKGAPRILPL